MSRVSLKFYSYISGKIITLAAIAIVLIYISLILGTAGISPELILWLASGCLIIIGIWLVIDFSYRKHRINELYKKLDKLSDKYLAGELIGTPSDSVETMYFNIMKEISRSAIGAVERAEHEKREYCDYVESWVHEIKTPLTACSLILANDGDTDKLKREIKRADNQTENILYYARLRTYEKDIQISEASIKEIVENALHNEMELLIAAGISVEPEGDFYVNTDPKLLEFIIKQFLINCAKYCKGCHIIVSAKNNILTIEDNGPGIPSHELPRIFQRGFTGAAWRTAGNSTGMGLYIVSELCKKLNIALNVESEEGEFTRFIMEFCNIISYKNVR